MNLSFEGGVTIEYRNKQGNHHAYDKFNLISNRLAITIAYFHMFNPATHAARLSFVVSAMIFCFLHGQSSAIDINMLSDGSWVAIPDGAGPFPGVLYSHGGFGANPGGDLEKTAMRLAESGFIGYAKKRSDTSFSLDDSLADILDGSDGLLDLQQVDSTRLALIGFSRGGLLSLRVSQLYPEQFKTAVLMAPAPGKIFPDGSTTMDQYLMAENMALLNDTSQFLVMVANNDVDATVDHVAIADNAYDKLLEYHIGADWHKFADYQDPDSQCPSTDPVGHCMFQSQDSGGQALMERDGYYWNHVITHLNVNLSYILGDFDSDGDIDGDDFLIWQAEFPTFSNATAGDGDADGDVDGDDFLIWQQHFSFPSSMVTTPEPHSLLLLMGLGTIFLPANRRRRAV